MKSRNRYVDGLTEFVGQDRRRWRYISVVFAATLATLTVGCSEDAAIGRLGPNDAEALAAVQFAIAHGANLLAVPLPRGVTVSRVIVRACESATPQNGYRCNVSVATADIPIVGGLAADLVLRFSKGTDGLWMAFVS